MDTGETSLTIIIEMTENNSFCPPPLNFLFCRPESDLSLVRDTNHFKEQFLLVVDGKTS